MLGNFVLHFVIIYTLLLVHSESAVRKKNAGNKVRNLRKGDSSSSDSSDSSSDVVDKLQNTNCWMTLNAAKHIEAMENLEAEYAKDRDAFRKAIEKEKVNFDEMVIKAMIESRGKLGNADQENGPYDIPAGLNLGGYCMVKTPESILFFQRVKLRNNTRFLINSIQTDLDNMRINAHFSLNDLHLHGSYERAWNPPGGSDPSDLYYVPTYGLADILLQDVDYKIEGRLRLIGSDTLYIVLTNSEISFPQGLLTHQNNATHSITHDVNEDGILEFIDRMKSDLDEWVRDYLNEHLVFFSVSSAINDGVREYHKKRNAELNNYVEQALLTLKKKIGQINAKSVALPNFRLFSNVDFRLTDGVLRGLDTIYRRSVAMGGMEGNIRKVDAIVGFSNLKAQYKYTAILTNGMPPLTGLVILSADDLTTHMSMSLVKDPESADLNFDFIHQFKPESLTVEGPANRMIGNYKHLLEHHIISIMSSGIYHNVRELRTLVKCQPSLQGRPDSGEKVQNLEYKSDDQVRAQSDYGPIIENNGNTQSTSVSEEKTSDADNEPSDNGQDVAEETVKNREQLESQASETIENLKISDSSNQSVENRRKLKKPNKRRKKLNKKQF